MPLKKIGIVRDEHFFCENPLEKTLIEISVVSPEALFTAELARLDEFLKSFNFS